MEDARKEAIKEMTKVKQPDGESSSEEEEDKYVDDLEMVLMVSTMKHDEAERNMAGLSI